MMMTCCEVRYSLLDYFHDALSLPERAEFEQHLTVCRMCAEEAARTRRTLRLSRSALARMPEPSPRDVPESLLRDILAAGQSWG